MYQKMFKYFTTPRASSVKSSFLFLGILLFFAFFFTGCEKKSNQQIQADNQANNLTKLKVWVMGEKNYFEALGREFKSSLGVDNLVVEVTSFDDSASLEFFLTQSLAEGKGPDAVYINGEWIAQNKAKFIPHAESDTFTPEAFGNVFVQSTRDVLIDNNEIYGVPMGVDTLAIFFDESKILDHLPDRNLPGRTWNEIQQDTIFLTKRDNSFDRFAQSGIAIGRLDNITYGYEILENILFQLGTKFFSSDGQEATFARANGAIQGKRINLGLDGVNIFTSFANPKMKHQSWNELLARSRDKDFEAFAKGDVSMIFGYASDVPRLKELFKQHNPTLRLDQAQKEFRVAFFPQINDPNLGGSRKVLAQVKALAVPRSAKYKNTAWQFLEFAIQRENLQNFFEKSKIPTPRVNLILKQENDPDVGIFVRQVKFARANPYPPPIKKEFLKNGFTDLVNKSNQDPKKTKKLLDELERLVTQKIRWYQAQKKALK